MDLYLLELFVVFLVLCLSERVSGRQCMCGACGVLLSLKDWTKD